MITLWELGGKDGRRYSLFSWRTRMALRHKRLAFETVPVCMSDKAAIAFSGGKTVPIVKDGETVVRDSWKIAEYLEARYPTRRRCSAARSAGRDAGVQRLGRSRAGAADAALIVLTCTTGSIPRTSGISVESMEILKMTLEEARTGAQAMSG